MKPDSSQWRNSATYDFVRDAAADIVAWEFLRRNPDYQRDFVKSQTGKDARDEIVRQRWRLQFRRPTRLVRS
jgi:hypothetical protein